MITDQSGVSAMEFALIAPVMILLFMGSIELPRAYTTGQHANRAARSMADLIFPNDIDHDGDRGRL